jgi:hypothetical protein
VNAIVVSNTDKKTWPHRINTDEDGVVDIAGKNRTILKMNKEIEN